jgi:hypothetical protein
VVAGAVVPDSGSMPRRPDSEVVPTRKSLHLAAEVVAAEVAEWFRLGRESLDVWGVDVSADEPSRPQIVPEHFDLGTTAGRVNYGFSPGDEAIAAPYVYIGPHDPPSDDPYWNASFGAYRTWDEITSVEDALAFFRAGRRVLGR